MESETMIAPAIDVVSNGEQAAPAVIEIVSNSPVEVSVAQVGKGWFEIVSSKFPNTVPSWAVEAGVFGVSSFVLGFLLKCCGRLLVVALLVGAAVLAGLHFSNVMPLDLVKIKQLAGLADVSSLTEVPALFYEWAKAHVVACVSVVVGFVIGWKLG